MIAAKGASTESTDGPVTITNTKRAVGMVLRSTATVLLNRNAKHKPHHD